MKLPAVVAHADWSLGPAKRWIAHAWLRDDGTYEVFPPRRVPDASSLLRRLAHDARGGTALAGFDFPIGVPLAYADRAGIESFPSLFSEIGSGIWRDFYRVAERPHEISLYRPFYPQRPGGTSQQHLLDGLGVESMSKLLRTCDRKTATRNQACALFWTLGGNQVGKAAIAGWREMLAPAIGDPSVRVWPFDGTLADLLQEPGVVVAETYPTEFYGHLGVTLNGSKRVSENRARQRRAFDAWLRKPEIEGRVRFAPEADATVEGGFGPHKDGEDPFDAFVGLLGMLNVVLGRRSEGWPVDPRRRAVEGWILGQRA